MPNIQIVKIVVRYDADAVAATPDVHPFRQAEAELLAVPGVVSTYVEIPPAPFHWGSLPESRMQNAVMSGA